MTDKTSALKARIAELEAERDSLAGFVRAFINHGCPHCGGDCSSANPPMNYCPMQEARAALRDGGARE